MADIGYKLIVLKDSMNNKKRNRWIKFLNLQQKKIKLFTYFGNNYKILKSKCDKFDKTCRMNNRTINHFVIKIVI